MDNYTPQIGDIVWINFNPTKGHEQAGHRPALVLSNTKYNDVTGLMIVVPITSKAKGYAGEIALPSDCPVQGVLLCDQIRNLDWIERPPKWGEVNLGVGIVKKVLRRLTTLCSE